MPDTRIKIGSRYSQELERLRNIAEKRTPITEQGVARAAAINERERQAIVANYALRATESEEIRKTLGISNNAEFYVNQNNQGIIKDNPLNEYIDVQYHIAFSMVSQKKAVRFQMNGYEAGANDAVNETERRSKAETQSDRIVIASTGETETTGGRNYYNISNYSIKNVTEPTESNPLVNTMLSAKIKIIEPLGFKFYEDINDIAGELGYKNVNYGRYVFQVDVWFSGYKEDGLWVEKIDLSGNDKGITTISTYMSITSFDADVTNRGTEYDIGLVPLGHHAYRPEDIMLDVEVIRSGNTFGEFLNNLAASMNVAKRLRTQNQIVRNYEFYAPNILLNSPFAVDSFLHKNKHFFTDANDRTITVGKNVDLLTFLRGAIANSQTVQDLFIADDNNDFFTNPRIHFGIRFNTIYGTPFGITESDAELNDYKEITHQYVIEPYITFKHGPITRKNINDYTASLSQLRRIQEIVRLGMMKKIYNYVNTSENTEVVDMSIKLRPFFYYSLDTLESTDASPGRAFDSKSASDATDVRVEENARIESAVIDLGTLPSPAEDDTLRRIFGVRNPTIVSTSHGWQKLGGSFNEYSDTGIYGDTASDPSGRRHDYELYMEDYLSADLLRLNGLKIKGDPTWLLSPYSSHDIDEFIRINGFEDQRNRRGERGPTAINPRLGQIIFLKMLPPHQDDLQNPDRQRATSARTIIGGFYQVLWVESEFSGGQFMQTIEAVKLNHLNYVEDAFQEQEIR